MGCCEGKGPCDGVISLSKYPCASGTVSPQLKGHLTFCKHPFCLLSSDMFSRWSPSWPSSQSSCFSLLVLGLLAGETETLSCTSFPLPRPPNRWSLEVNPGYQNWQLQAGRSRELGSRGQQGLRLCFVQAKPARSWDTSRQLSRRYSQSPVSQSPEFRPFP